MWAQLWAQATSLAEKCGVAVTPSRRPCRRQRLPWQLDAVFLVDSAMVTVRETLV
jgi:hypothetical protein